MTVAFSCEATSARKRRLQLKHARHNAFLLVVLASGMLMLGVALQGAPSTPTVDTDTPRSEYLLSTEPPFRDSSGTSVPLSASGPEPTPAVSTPARVEAPSPLPFSSQRLVPSEPISRPSEVTPVMSLPLDSQEFMPDGLPASAIRCMRDGGVYTCGSCRTDGDCPPGRACLPNRETRRFECLDAECEEDVH